MIPVALAAQTASTLISSLHGKHGAGGPLNSAGQAAQQFGAQLDALLPGTGAVGNTVGNIASLGQDLLNSLGLGGGAGSAASPQQAAQAYAAAGTAPALGAH